MCLKKAMAMTIGDEPRICYKVVQLQIGLQGDRLISPWMEQEYKVGETVRATGRCDVRYEELETPCEDLDDSGTPVTVIGEYEVGSGFLHCCDTAFDAMKYMDCPNRPTWNYAVLECEILAGTRVFYGTWDYSTIKSIATPALTVKRVMNFEDFMHAVGEEGIPIQEDMFENVKKRYSVYVP